MWKCTFTNTTSDFLLFISNPPTPLSRPYPSPAVGLHCALGCLRIVLWPVRLQQQRLLFSLCVSGLFLEARRTLLEAFTNNSAAPRGSRNEKRQPAVPFQLLRPHALILLMKSFDKSSCLRLNPSDIFVWAFVNLFQWGRMDHLYVNLCVTM